MRSPDPLERRRAWRRTVLCLVVALCGCNGLVSSAELAIASGGVGPGAPGDDASSGSGGAPAAPITGGASSGGAPTAGGGGESGIAGSGGVSGSSGSGGESASGGSGGGSVVTVSYNYNFCSCSGVTLMAPGEMFEIWNKPGGGPGNDVARCYLSESGLLRAYNFDSAATVPEWGPEISSGCSSAVFASFVVACCFQ